MLHYPTTIGDLSDYSEVTLKDIRTPNAILFFKANEARANFSDTNKATKNRIDNLTK